MKRRRDRIPNDDNNRWYERYGEGGYFCLPRTLVFTLVDRIDNATLYVYLALASCHIEGNTTFAGSPYVAKLTGKDERSARRHLKDLETLGLIRRERLGDGFRVLFECPDRARIRQGAQVIEARKQKLRERRKAAKAAKAAKATETNDVV